MASITGFQSLLKSGNLTISNGGTTSDVLELGGTILSGIIISTTLTGTELTFLASFDGTNYYTLRDEAGNSVSLPISNGAGIYNLNEEQFVHINFVKVVSNASEGAERTLTLIARPL